MNAERERDLFEEINTAFENLTVINADYVEPRQFLEDVDCACSNECERERVAL